MEMLTKLSKMIEGPSFWIGALIGAFVLILVGLVISWFWGKPVVKFYIDGECITMTPSSKGEKLVVPIGMREYSWFLDKEMTMPLPKEYIIKKRVINVFSSKSKMMSGIEN